MRFYDSTLNMFWQYNERHHGKGPMDGVRDTIKNCVFRDVKSGKCLINTPEDFAIYVDQSIKGISILYLPQKEVFKEPEEIVSAPRIPETLQIMVDYL